MIKYDVNANFISKSNMRAVVMVCVKECRKYTGVCFTIEDARPGCP